MRLLALGLLALSLSACSFNKDNSVGPDPAIARQNSQVNAIYAPLVGTYTGKMTIGSSIQDIRIVLSIRSVDTTNSDGTPTTKLVPIATFTRLNPAGPDVAMNWAFTPETSAFALSAIEAGGGSNPPTHREDDVKTVDGTLQNDVITAQLGNYQGIHIGTAELRKSSDQSGDPNGRNERLRRLYESIAGQYCGTIRDPYDAKKPQIIKVELRLTYVQDPTSPTGSRPSLMGYYDRLDKPAGLLDLQMMVTYDTPPSINLYGKGLRNYSVTFNGVVTAAQRNQDGSITNPGKIDAELFTGVDGRVGSLTLKQNDALCRVQRPAGFN